MEYIDDNEFQIWIQRNVLLYADDTVLLGDTPSDLQKSLDIFKEKRSRWKLEVNVPKRK